MRYCGSSFLQFAGALLLAMGIMVETVRADVVVVPTPITCDCLGCPANIPKEDHCSDKPCYDILWGCDDDCACQGNGPVAGNNRPCKCK